MRRDFAAQNNAVERRARSSRFAPVGVRRAGSRGRQIAPIVRLVRLQMFSVGPVCTKSRYSSKIRMVSPISVTTAGDTEAIGWITSPPGDYTPNPEATGKLSFGLCSQISRCATNPKGETLVDFLAGD